MNGWDYVKTMLKFIVICTHVKMIIEGLRFVVDFIFGSGERGFQLIIIELKLIIHEGCIYCPNTHVIRASWICKEIEFVIPCEVLIFYITQCAWWFNSPPIFFAICNF